MQPTLLDATMSRLPDRGGGSTPAVLPVDEDRSTVICPIPRTSKHCACGEDNHFIHALPYEMFTEIFKLCTYGDEDEYPSITRSPLLLCHVCRYWRQVVWELPCLWTSLLIPIDSEIAVRNAECLLVLWLERSQGRPILFEYAFPGGTTNDQSFLNVIVSRLDRFLVLDLCIPKSIADALLYAEPGRVEALEELDIFISTNAFDAAALVKPIPVFEVAPNLNTVHIGSRYAFDTSLFRLPWTQLVHLHLENTLIQPTANHILSECTNLEECDLTVYDWLPQGVLRAVDEGCIILPFLRELHLCLIFCSGCEFFFHHLTAPSLRILDVTIQKLEDVVEWPHTTIMKFRSRSKFRLKTLEIKSDEMTTAQLVEFLREVPAVSRLSVCGLLVVSSELYVHLTRYNGDEDNLLPRLQSLDLRRDGDPDIDYDAVINMVESRWRLLPTLVVGHVRLAQLLEFTLSLPSIENPEVLEERLQKYKMEGLKVTYFL